MPSFYPRLDERCAQLAAAFEEEGAEAGLSLKVNTLGGAAHAFVSDRPVKSFDQTDLADDAAYRRFAAEMLAEGVHLIPRGLLYVSTAHGDEELAATRAAVGRAAKRTAAASLQTA